MIRVKLNCLVLLPPKLSSNSNNHHHRFTTANSCGYCSSSSGCVTLAFQDAEAVLFSGDEVSINTPGGSFGLWQYQSRKYYSQELTATQQLSYPRKVCEIFFFGDMSFLEGKSLPSQNQFKEKFAVVFTKKVGNRTVLGNLVSRNPRFMFFCSVTTLI